VADAKFRMKALCLRADRYPYFRLDTRGEYSRERKTSWRRGSWSTKRDALKGHQRIQHARCPAKDVGHAQPEGIGCTARDHFLLQANLLCPAESLPSGVCVITLPKLSFRAERGISP